MMMTQGLAQGQQARRPARPPISGAAVVVVWLGVLARSVTVVDDDGAW
jgi:hypothetical protein